jgi:predicted transcriptional regulator
VRYKKINSVIRSNLDVFGEGMAENDDNDSMGKEERKRQVLGLLVESGLALPPTAILWNCKAEGATFERRTLDNYVEELVEDGYIKKVDEKRGYYQATQSGRDYYFNN